jgi:uncharacterized membrane-anchored protein
MHMSGEKPIKRHKDGRYTHGRTPYQWRRDNAAGWRIGFGYSSYLVAKGSGASIGVGMKLLRDLQGEWMHRRKARRPIKK